jgi:putative toxin-antitoxin system antitoxin component (TIGR02293 family)
MTVHGIAQVLGGKNTLKKQIGTSAELVELTRRGLPVTTILFVANDLAVQRTAVARVLGISDRTLSRRVASSSRLTAEESDRVVRRARVLAIANDTFDDKTKAARWLQTPNRALEGDKPFDRLDTDAGVQSVEEVLGRIAYGVYS